jgi:hypothetical protein
VLATRSSLRSDLDAKGYPIAPDELREVRAQFARSLWLIYLVYFSTANIAIFYVLKAPEHAFPREIVMVPYSYVAYINAQPPP